MKYSYSEVAADCNNGPIIVIVIILIIHLIIDLDIILDINSENRKYNPLISAGFISNIENKIRF